MPTTPTTLEGAIRALLLADAGVSAITTAVYPFTDPQNTPRPKLTIHRWGADMTAQTGGMSNDGSTGYEVAKLYIDAWADTLLAAKQLADAAQLALHGKTAAFGIGLVRVADKREQPTATVAGQEKPVQRVTLDVRASFINTAGD